MIVGVLALQGAVEPQFAHLRALGATPRKILRAEDLDGIDRLILPGGESTTMLRLLEISALFEPLRRVASLVPTWGICAGAILLAREVRNPTQPSLALLDIAIERNAYGRQLDGFGKVVEGAAVAFVRAPRIAEVGPGVTVRATHDGAPIWVESGLLRATTFHPELSAARPSPLHRSFCAA